MIKYHPNPPVKGDRITVHGGTLKGQSGTVMSRTITAQGRPGLLIRMDTGVIVECEPYMLLEETTP